MAAADTCVDVDKAAVDSSSDSSDSIRVSA